ncbi:ArsA family ATPase [Aeropyrum camini]|uniref:ArsA family ATPase n=1 Tax=Aeropyrum camini TaxID=229980 RepID=UPI000AF75E4D|nr:ArsA family ATPase [Aeropyrum camini]
MGGVGLGGLVEKAIPAITGSEGPHVVFVTGKGGVGKTTVSILLATLLSRLGETLVISLDQAKHLQEYLGLEEVNRVYNVRGSLYAMQFDTGGDIDKLSSEYMTLMKRIMPGLKVLNLESTVEIVKNAPGLEEEVYLRKVLELYSDTRFRYVVVDTPPTGLTLRILGLPRLYTFWIESLIGIRERIVSLRYVIARSIGREPEVDDPVLDRLRELKERYSRLSRDLGNRERTSFAIVATPEPLPVYEARKTVEFLESMGAKPSIIVVNRILPADIASRLGVQEIQSKALNEIRSGVCRKPCVLVEIPMVETVPSSLEAVVNLVERSKGAVLE